MDDLSITAWTSQTPAGGDVRLSAGQVLYTPPTNACGADSFSYVAGDLAGGASIGTATITLECFQISGQVALEGYRGPARNGSGTRPVTFTSTDAGGTPLATWTQSLTFAGGVASYTLANVPAGTANLSAKTAWNLRKRLSATFSAYAATVNFTGANLLPAGDLDNSNLVDILDYYRLAAAWYQPNAAADLDGSGLVDLDDYFLLASRWSELGDPQ